MVCCGPVSGVVMAILFLAAGYYLYTPVPDDITNPRLLQAVCAGFRAINLMGRFGEKLGLTNQHAFCRNSLNYLARLLPHGDPDVQVTNTTFEGVPVRIYRPKSAPSLSPALVYYHGGGWIWGSIDLYDSVTSNLAKQSGMVVVSVEYRLAPEHPFPFPFEDCARATTHLLQNGQRYGVDPKRVAVGGDSAGGNLAAAVSLRLSEEAEDYLPRIKLQVLVYPAVQALSFSLPAFNKYGHLFLSPAMVAGAWHAYMGLDDSQNLVPALMEGKHASPLLKKSEFGMAISPSALPLEYQTKEEEGDGAAKGDNQGDVELAARLEPLLTNPYLAPLMAPSVKGVPPAVVFVAEKDVLRDEGLMYYEKLRRGGVTAHLEYDTTAFHACFFPGFEGGQKWVLKIAEYLKKYV